jgi:hypothetical protein
VRRGNHGAVSEHERRIEDAEAIVVRDRVDDVQTEQLRVGAEIDPVTAAKQVQRPDDRMAADPHAADVQEHHTVSHAGVVFDRQLGAIEKGDAEPHTLPDVEAEHRPQNRLLESRRQQGGCREADGTNRTGELAPGSSHA